VLVAHGHLSAATIVSSVARLSALAAKNVSMRSSCSHIVRRLRAELGAGTRDAQDEETSRSPTPH
jgi:hypothetical protein